MFNWQAQADKLLARGVVFCLVRIIKTEGSTPRDVGTVMLVTHTHEYGTIGGGNLENAAINAARECLGTTNTKTKTLEYILGPDVEQCCGGRVELSLQRITSRAELPDIPFVQLSPVFLFGAGHVGTALIQALSPLPFQVFCFDTRLEHSTLPHSCHPGLDPGPHSLRLGRGPGAEAGMTKGSANIFLQNTIIQHLANPTDIISSAPINTYFLIMTHDHNLDYELVSAILKRDDFTFLGLIGSKTKKARFISRLKKDGYAPAQLARITCPVGIEGIQGKAPEIIAASVAAQLLQITGQ